MQNIFFIVPFLFLLSLQGAEGSLKVNISPEDTQLTEKSLKINLNPEDTQQNHITALRQRLTVLEKEIAELKREVTTIEQLKIDITSIKRELINLNNTYEKRFYEIPASITELKNQFTNSEDQIKKVIQQYQSFQTQYTQPTIVPRFGNFPPDTSALAERAFEH